MAEINGIKVPFVPLVQKTESPLRLEKRTGFDSIFQEELSKIKFSQHALKRLETRNIEITESEMVKIESAVDKAELKGSKDSLVVMDGTAFIINIPNRTVITALPVNNNDDNIFTNIDSIVFT